MSEVERQAIGKTSLKQLGDLPPEALLDFMASVSRHLQDAIWRKWSQQLSPNGLQV